VAQKPIFYFKIELCEKKPFFWLNLRIDRNLVKYFNVTEVLLLRARERASWLREIVWALKVRLQAGARSSRRKFSVMTHALRIHKQERVVVSFAL